MQFPGRDEASQLSEAQAALTVVSTAPQPIVAPVQSENNIEEYQTVPVIAASDVPVTSSGSSHGVYVNMVEQAIHRLNDAARRIAAVDQNEKRQPHASRLSPLRDISGDIQRHSTPLPKAIVDTGKMKQKGTEVSSKDMPDLWPWLPDTDDIDNNNTWENYTDPLQSRHFPNGLESARIEAEDERRARAAGLIASPAGRKTTRTMHLRIAFVSLAILAILALTIDTTLVSVAFLHPHHTVVPVGGPPTLTLSIKDTKDNKVYMGQAVTILLTHFTPATSVYITRDVGVPILLNSGFPVARIDKNGSATTSTVISKDWSPGFHNVEAEDIVSHYTANATLQIVGAGSSKPSHLIIKTLSVDMGSDHQGSNTIQNFVLSNDVNASGAIVWSASSNSPWLMLTPNEGTFSDSQTLSIAVERGAMKPQSYHGKITFSSNVSAPIVVNVEMTVTPLPPDAGAVLMVAPPVLSFTTSEGTASTDSQTLTVSNPGHQPLPWSLTNNQPLAQSGQGPFLSMGAMSFMTANWLHVDGSSGTVAPGATQDIHISVNNQNLTHGLYTNTLVFSSADPKTINHTQSVSVSLTIQPHCSLLPSVGQLTFNAVQNSSNASNQTINVSTTSNCSSSLSVQWQATTVSNWLSITPANGVAKSGTNSVITVGVNAAGMTPGTYNAAITVASNLDGNAQGSTTINVVLIVQAPPQPGAPVMAAAPLQISFSAVEGQPITSGQTMLITNTGQSAMKWSTNITALATAWLSISPTGGVINPGQTATMTIRAATNGLTPAAYNTIVTLTAYDAKTGQTLVVGAPQSITVSLTINPPCALVQPSSSSLAFNAVVGGADPASQAVTLTASGNCAWPLGWNATVSPAAPWLNLSATSGSFGPSGLATSINISASAVGQSPGSHTAQVSISTQDSSGIVAQGSPQVFSITLNVLPACELSPVSSGLTFTVAEGQTVPSQAFSINETGTCVRPVSWSTNVDSSSTSWLTLSSASGSDTGGGASDNVSVNAATRAPGTYKGYITVTTSNGATINNGTQIIPVTLNVTGYSLSGTVNLCADAICATPLALPAASVVLTASGGTPVNAIADANGNYSFSNLALGAYTVSASGLNSAALHYTGSVSVTVSGNKLGVNVNLLPG